LLRNLYKVDLNAILEIMQEDDRPHLNAYMHIPAIYSLFFHR